jgi:hydroxyethylthiazole kinase-like uncharacterized protein yjeF
VSTVTISLDPTTQLRLPAADPALFEKDMDLVRLMNHWAPQAQLRAMTAEQMRGADVRAQRMGVTGTQLMEDAGAAVAATARALMLSADRPLDGSVLMLCGAGNNGGDGFVAARRLAEVGIRSEVVLVSSDDKLSTPDAQRNWERLDGIDLVGRVHAPRKHDVAIFFNGIERAALIVDALLGTGMSGELREPVRTAVDVAVRGRELLVPVLAVDTPTSLSLSNGTPSDPNVHADATITFHRPKVGLSGRAAEALAGRVLVAPIGIPRLADPE